MATAQPTEQTQITSTIPKYAEPYAQYLLGSVFGGVDPATGKFMPGLIGQGYQQFKGQTVAGFNPLQQRAMEDIAGMRIAPQIGEASGLASLAGRRAQQVGQYDPYQATNYYQDPRMREMGFDYDRVSTQSFTRPGATEDYMSPYMQGVVERQKAQALRDYSRQIPGLQSQGIRSGARGGTREALLQAESQRNLQNQLGDLQAAGLQSAFQQGQQQFNTEQATRLQAALANQQARQGTQQMALNQLQNLNQLAMQGAGQRAQYGLAGANLAEQSRQFGAGLGMQGLQQQLAAAGQLGNLGQLQYQQGMGINAAQLGAGGQMQALEQQILNQKLQDFINQQQLPYKQAEFGMGILRGIPATGQTSTFYQQPGSLFGQIAGVGLGLGSLFGGLGGSK